jgi:cellulose synthase/poly-beta-1,6-N-acetylglucosamine synthase-like glycosyltransferase
MIFFYIYILIFVFSLISLIYYLINSYSSVFYHDKVNVEGYSPKDVTIIVPVYNEDVGTFERVISGLQYQGSKFIVVGDSSLEPYRNITESSGGTFLYKEQREGKRKAIAYAMKLVDTPFVMFVDSDAVLPPNGVNELLKKFEDDVGGVSGLIKIDNNGSAVSYSSEFGERAREVVLKATSMHGNVLYLDGACSVYRTNLVKDFILSEEFTDYKVMGKISLLGDDRQLSSFVIKSGYRIARNFNVTVTTKSQKDFKSYFKQQVRWSRTGWVSLFRDARNGTLRKAGSFYSFEIFYVYIIPLLLFIIGFLRFGFYLIPIYHHIGHLDVYFLEKYTVFVFTSTFMGFHVADKFLLARVFTVIANISGSAVFGIAVSATMVKEKLKTFAYGSIALVIMFAAAIYGLFTFWKQGKWMTR